MTWLEASFAECRPRAIAALTRQFRDMDIAEEAFGDACLKALSVWPKSGAPKNPFAWLLVASRNAGIDRLRKMKRQAAWAKSPPDADLPPVEDTQIGIIDEDGLRDDVLRLLFICCHPALKRQDQLAVALKIVAGMSVAEIARAFLIKPKTMERRITRAKRTISENPIPFEVPSLAERARRLNEVSLMVYLLFNEGWSTSGSETQFKLALCEEAIRLARLLLDLFPGMSEQMGLLALLLFQHSRRQTRMNVDGELVSLENQVREKWDHSMIAEANVLLEKAARHGTAGPYQLQAAIAGTHAIAPSDRETDWARIESLYGSLYRIHPTPVIRLNQAAAVSRTLGPVAALEMIEPLAGELATYRWFHTARAFFLSDFGDYAGAAAAYRTAANLQPTLPELRILKEKIIECEKNFHSLSESQASHRP